MIKLTALAAAGVLYAETQGTAVELVYVGPEDHPAFLGVTQGLDEATLQGRFLGQRYTLRLLDDSSRVPAAAAVLAAVDDEALVELAKGHPQIPVFDLTSENDALRALCLPNLLHIIPSRGMKDEAIAQWRKLHPGAEVRIQAWHPAFTKYAAEQLSKRFLKARGRPMDDEAWAGWAAVKLVSDTVARLASPDPRQILAYFKTEIAFDGQKGIDLSFRPDGRLRQPLWIVAHGKVVGEAPVKGVVEPEDLDSLGRSACP